MVIYGCNSNHSSAIIKQINNSKIFITNINLSMYDTIESFHFRGNRFNIKTLSCSKYKNIDKDSLQYLYKNLYNDVARYNLVGYGDSYLDTLGLGKVFYFYEPIAIYELKNADYKKNPRWSSYLDNAIDSFKNFRTVIMK